MSPQIGAPPAEKPRSAAQARMDILWGQFQDQTNLPPPLPVLPPVMPESPHEKEKARHARLDELVWRARNAQADKSTAQQAEQSIAWQKARFSRRRKELELRRATQVAPGCQPEAFGEAPPEDGAVAGLSA